MKRFEGKVVVVTGGTQGLGAAVATHLAAEGAAGIVTCGRSSGKGEAVARRIAEQTGCAVHFVQADLTKVADCRQVIEAADEIFGRVDVLVNAAGLTERGNILTTDEDLFDRMFAVNTRAPFFLMQEVIKRMIRDDIEGTIINIGSIVEHAGQPFNASYCGSKAALATLTRNTAFAAMRNRIRVNQLNIGWMASDGEDRIQREFHGADDNWLETVAAQQPFGRLLAPAEVAKAVAFLGCDDSGMMTGSVINFDQSVWGGYQYGPPTPEAKLAL
ncbi:SDR family oxidoreductase [Pseudomonas eucalypticola]|uniref:SDR family oxidoreductase n=1 Tax=Pseudomonas eucalypticola TaxID=2599595 RepID=A0A7D5HQ29_9PSED|nr:SDR family oxidoreductase [Pseudomonas eucalypticola]QKZ05748.1 SDR family oxidoreductase [Pseudomonas eucalypticola]